MSVRDSFSNTRRWVIKVGSSLVTNQGQGLDCERIADWVGQIAQLRNDGVDEIVLVSSGAVAEGMARLGMKTRPREVNYLQAAAAVGQMGLVKAYEAKFQQYGLHTAQVLLTHDDLADRHRYLNARSAIQAILELGAIPVINENDTVAVEEICLGDNDTLAAMVANLLAADVLVILTDQVGMFEADPRQDPNAAMIHEARAGDERLEAMASSGGVGALGRGGMVTKVRAAKRAARSGAATVIASGRETDVLMRVRSGERLGTLIYSEQAPLVARKQWLATRLQVKGVLHLDAGAVNVLKAEGKSLLSVGVVEVDGVFQRGDLVSCVDNLTGCELARGLVNYSVEEVRLIKGLASGKIEAVLGYMDEPELIHRDNLVLL